MKEVQTLISKYKAGTATPGELKRLLQLLDTDDATLQEWLRTEYDEDLVAMTKVLSGQRSADIWKKIQEKKEQRLPSPKVIRLPWRTISWAAACILVTLAAVRLLLPVKHTPATGMTALSSTPAPEMKQVSNPGPAKMQMILSDQSVVVLEPNSAMTWYENFDSIKRDISLSGKALFKVAKDEKRPFTVYANGIATTALGTQFSVNTLTENKIEVKLFEGKVKVASAGNNLTMKPIYLEPGQAFTINTQLHQYAVSRFERMPKPSHISGETAKPATAEALVFDREPLSSVFEKIRVQYKVHIVYDESEIDGLHFTGTILQSDSLQMVLSVICNMNSLVFKQDRNNISISKIK